MKTRNNINLIPYNGNFQAIEKLKNFFILYKIHKMTTFTRGEGNGKPRRLTAGLLGLSMFFVGACRMTPEGRNFINTMGYNAAGTFIQESIKSEMGHSDYQQQRVNQQRRVQRGQSVNIIQIPRYQIGDMYVTPGEINTWVRVKENLWTSTTISGKQVTANDIEVTIFSRNSGLPIIRAQ